MATCLILFDNENQNNEVTKIIDWYPDFSFLKIGYSIKNIQSQNILEIVKKEEISRLIILIGESTIYLNESFKRDIEELAKLDLSIICFNINECLSLDENNCPKFISSIGAVHMPLTKKDVVFTLKNHKVNSRKEYKTGFYYMKRNFPFDDPSFY